MSYQEETLILEEIAHKDTPIRQRDLAELTGLSLGMTNGLLKKFVQKGFLLMEKVNQRNIRYALTSQGWQELNRRTRQYLKKNLKNVVNYRESIEHLVLDVQKQGYKRIVLRGQSELAFILEWACNRYEMDFAESVCPTEKDFIIDSQEGIPLVEQYREAFA